MSNTKSKINGQVHPVSATKRMLQGAAIALVLISLFLFTARNPDPSWPEFWRLKPLIIVPIAGAMGGLFYYFMDHLRYEGGWKKILAMLLSIIGYLVAIWMGTILGLNGTMWN